MYKIINKKLLNFNKLKDWKTPEGENLPILSFLSVYRSVGLLQEIDDYLENIKISKQNLEENKDKIIEKSKICATQQLICNFYTLQRIRNLIDYNWKHYNLEIGGDNLINWKNNKHHNKLEYERTLSKKIQASITMDFANYCPGVDDELEDDVLLFIDGEIETGENENGKDE